MSKTTKLIKEKLKRYKAKKALEKDKSFRHESHIGEENDRTFRKYARAERFEDGRSPTPGSKQRVDKYHEEHDQLSRAKKTLHKRWNKVDLDEIDLPF